MKLPTRSTAMLVNTKEPRRELTRTVSEFGRPARLLREYAPCAALWWCHLACMLILCGCQTGGEKSTASSQPIRPTTGPVTLSIAVHSPQQEDPRDPLPQLTAMVHLDIYYLDLPPGSVAQNSEFWKRVNEESVGVVSRDLLEKNGIRAGIVPRSESAFFSSFFNALPHPPLRRSRVDGLHAETIKLEMETPFDRQDLFIFTSQQEQPQGRSYDSGSNNLILNFGPAPRDPSAVRVTVCPVVHSDRPRMQFTPRNREIQTHESETDHIYDLSLTADIPEDSFFIIAPSADAARRTSIGGAFLTKSDATQRREQVILIVPTFLRVDQQPKQLHELFLK